jgi:glycosyltransferase involved in cell wall biosynthesis
MKLINIIGEQTSGLAVDSQIIFAALNQGPFETKIRKVRQGWINGLVDRVIPCAYWNLFPSKLPDINIFCEQIFPKWLNTAKINILIPNQEWCRPSTLDFLPHIDKIFCKTHYAEAIFRNMGCDTSYIGFTSQDHYNERIEKNYRKFLHVAGKSLQKGTVPLARVWSKHPEWPSLTIITHNPAHISDYFAPNITVESQIPLERLRFLQNECGVHLCPSEAEGFGHVINEALACGAVVITTDAPPMNELVNPEYGFLVRHAQSSQQSLGINYYVDENDLSKTIQKVLISNLETLGKISMQSRKYYLDQKLFFNSRISEILTNS